MSKIIKQDHLGQPKTNVWGFFFTLCLNIFPIYKTNRWHLVQGSPWLTTDFSWFMTHVCKISPSKVKALNLLPNVIETAMISNHFIRNQSMHRLNFSFIMLPKDTSMCRREKSDIKPTTFQLVDNLVQLGFKIYYYIHIKYIIIV